MKLDGPGGVVLFVIGATCIKVKDKHSFSELLCRIKRRAAGNRMMSVVERGEKCGKTKRRNMSQLNKSTELIGLRIRSPEGSAGVGEQKDVNTGLYSILGLTQR
jgi:hypothetical protein